ncbi:hypothetical protein CDAR_221501 [Caerostris darwini]|uniref:Uncharacterized protein n=1 Tax=Caerostris darwini TaxID=1538125 RepID=A0AAV4WME4_9ARAC|nr:hypothetical protein CDAR_221501 [Caerostris darwini]
MPLMLFSVTTTSLSKACQKYVSFERGEKKLAYKRHHVGLRSLKNAPWGLSKAFLMKCGYHDNPTHCVAVFFLREGNGQSSGYWREFIIAAGFQGK